MLTMLMGNERRNRLIALVLAGVLVASVILALLATAASAAPAATVSGPPARAAVLPLHAQLVSITPADGARLDTAPITGQLSPGGYRIAWRVRSDDGNPVSGEATFTVTRPAGVGGGAVPLATPTYKTPQTQATSIGHPDHLPGIVVGGVLLLAGVALLIHEQRRRRSHLDEPIS